MQSGDKVRPFHGFVIPATMSVWIEVCIAGRKDEYFDDELKNQVFVRL